MKIATILDQQFGTFGLEYDNNLGKKNVMRLDAITYEKAIQEAKSFLEIKEDGYDADGNLWELD
jgi:hypothetical protein